MPPSCNWQPFTVLDAQTLQVRDPIDPTWCSRAAENIFKGSYFIFLIIIYWFIDVLQHVCYTTYYTSLEWKVHQLVPNLGNSLLVIQVISIQF